MNSLQHSCPLAPSSVVAALTLLLVGATFAHAEKLEADLSGRVLLFEPAETIDRQMDAHVILRSELGLIEDIEVYTEWSGPLGARQKSWEFYDVVGTQYAGYVERLFTDDSGIIRFSRTEVSGFISQEIDAKSGSGEVSWIIDEDGDFRDETEDPEDSDLDLDGVPDDIDPEIDTPERDADEEGELNLVLFRSINFKSTGDNDHPEVTLVEEGDETLSEGLARRHEAELEGIGDGSLAFDQNRANREREEALEEAQPDAQPDSGPSPDPTPDAELDNGFDEETDEFIDDPDPDPDIDSSI